MLVLSRQVDEGIIIIVPGQEDIRIVVTEIAGKKVRLGFECDKNVNILRQEIRDGE